MWSPSASALDSGFKATIAAPFVKIVPRAAASKGRTWPSGESTYYFPPFFKFRANLQSFSELKLDFLFGGKNINLFI